MTGHIAESSMNSAVRSILDIFQRTIEESFNLKKRTKYVLHVRPILPMLTREQALRDGFIMVKSCLLIT